jgi:hypothetical protein
MNLINPTPEEVEAEYVKAMTEVKILREEINNRLWAKKLGIEVPKRSDNEGEEE